MRKPPHPSDSVFAEPQWNNGRSDPAEATDSVWHEPTSAGVPGGPQIKPYAAWLSRMAQGVTDASSLGLCALMALVGGPLAVLSVLWTRAPGVGAILLVVSGPLIEELGKILFPLMVVERRPYLVRRSGHLPLCALASGLVFAVIENLLYLHVYLPDPSPLVVVWRWTVCVALHSGCSLLAGIGVMRIHAETMRTREPPRLETGAAWIVAAVLVHGIYNLLAIMIAPVLR